MMSIKSKLSSLIQEIFKILILMPTLTLILVCLACESDPKSSNGNVDQSQTSISTDQTIPSSDQNISTSDQNISTSDQSILDETSLQVQDCQTLCTNLSNCATSQCMPSDLNAFQSSCQDVCQQSSIFRRIGGGLDACNDLLSFSAQQMPTMIFESLHCQSDPANPPMLMACDTFARNYIRCLSDRCSSSPESPQTEVENILMKAYAHYCNEQADKGALNADQLALIAGDQSSCDMGILADMITERITVNAMGMGGDLKAYCENGAINSLETCEQACQRLSPCIAIDHEFAVLRNQDRCAELCLAHQDPPPQTWTCLSELSLYDCVSIPSCY